jgi:hypothetical protein
VPPPPVCGATVGVAGALVPEVGVGVAGVVLEAVACGEELAVALLLVVAVPVAELVGVLVEVVVDVAGKWVGPDEEEVDPPSVQPVTVTDARMAKTPKPMTVRFALSTAPAMVTCTVM